MAGLVGQRLGQYEIIGPLGQGGMATVYRARQLNIKREVAIKVMAAQLQADANFTRRFEREAQTVASLSHPHILKIFDYGQQDDMVYLVMELIPAGSLADKIKQGPIALPETRRLLDEIAQALDYAHLENIVHRDLKPQNVLVDDGGNALLTDFGIAKIMSEATALTQSGVAMGTPGYMPPEQWRGEELDGRADIYALGIMLFEMLSGGLPFNQSTPFSMMYSHVNEPPPSVVRKRPELPAGIDAVIDKALAKDRENRYQSAAEMSEAFTAAIQSGAATPPPPHPPASQEITDTERTAAEIPIPSTSSASSKPKIATPTTPPASRPTAAPPGQATMPPTIPPNAMPTRGPRATERAPRKLDSIVDSQPIAVVTPPPPPKASALPIIIGAVAAIIVVAILAVILLPKLTAPNVTATLSSAEATGQSSATALGAGASATAVPVIAQDASATSTEAPTITLTNTTEPTVASSATKTEALTVVAALPSATTAPTNTNAPPSATLTVGPNAATIGALTQAAGLPLTGTALALTQAALPITATTASIRPSVTPLVVANVATAIPPSLTFTSSPVPPTNTTIPTATTIPPTNTTVPPTNTTAPTVTAIPPTNTPVPPTSTTAPTATAIPPTATAIPPSITALPTATAIPPSITALPTDTATAIPSDTLVPPTSSPLPTDTETQTPSATPIPPTSTALPTDTETATEAPTDTVAPTDTTVPTVAATATTTATATPNGPTTAPGTTRADDKSVAQVWTPGGCFTMGTDPATVKGAGTDEQPPHQVCITQGFWLDQNLVTNAAFADFVTAGGYTNKQYWTDDGWAWLQANSITGPQDAANFGDPQQPRIGVSWYEADAYARWRGGRLPTEAEWEYSARGPQSHVYPWGDTFDKANANVQTKGTTPVGQFPAGVNWVGALDMSGNVWEWVNDWYSDTYYQQQIKDDPTGPETGDSRVMRGGAWDYSSVFARGASRSELSPDSRGYDIGFRIITP